MEITLIIPPSIFLVDERVFVSLGILRVAACLEKAGWKVTVIDLSGVDNYIEVIKDYLSKKEIKYVGITATSPQMSAVEKICETIRALSPARIILGGPHITMTVSAYKREKKLGVAARAVNAYKKINDMADVLVSGDGEKAIFLALKNDAPKLVDADDPKVDLFLNKDELGELPAPARHLVDLQSYKYSIEGRKATSLIAQLGCPYGCAFCGGRLSPTFRRARIRDSKSVIEELEFLYTHHGYTGFMFYDDELNVNPKMVEHMREICKLQERLGVDFRMRGFLKSNLVTEEQIKIMYEAGFRQILIGFESGNERILTNIQKKATRAQNTKCMELSHKYGMKVKALMSIGHAGESEQTIQDTHDWLLEVEPSDFDCTVISTYPGTPYYDEAIRLDETKNIWTYTAITGDKLHSYEIDFVKDSNYYKGLPGEYRSYVYTDFITDENLVKMRDWLENSVRTKLNIPFYLPTPATKYEHSMGQTDIQLPNTIVRSTLIS